MEIFGDILDEILSSVISMTNFEEYYEVCNAKVSLANLMRSAKKNFPSFACENLKRKYSIPDYEGKLIKTSLNKENYQTGVEKIIEETKVLNPYKVNICCVCGEVVKSNIRKLVCNHVVHSVCLQNFYKNNSGCPRCKGLY